MEETLKIDLKKHSLSTINKHKQKQNVEIPDDYIEIIPKYLGIYQGCWLKYIDKGTMISYAGGYFIEYDNDKVVLRNIRRDIFELKVDDNFFYCKNDVPNHEAVKEIVKEKEKLSIKIHQFNIEKQKFLEKQKKFFS